MNELWVARHAPVEVSGICYGRANVDVARPSGESAGELCRLFPAPNKAQVVWSSRTARCLHVARELALRWHVVHRADELLSELDFGAWEGRAWADIEASDADAYNEWMRDWQNVAPPGGERTADIEARARRWLATLDRSVQHVLIGHAGFIRALQVVATGICWADALRGAVPHLTWLSIRLPAPETPAACAAPGSH